MKTGALVDATIIALASEDDEEGRWIKHKGRPEVFADSAYRGNHFGDAARAKEGAPRIVATGMWGRIEAGSRRSSAHGNKATAFAECDGEAWQSQACKFASLPSPTL